LTIPQRYGMLNVYHIFLFHRRISMTKAIIFDLFETLVTEWGHEKYTKRQMSADLGIPLELFSEHWEALHERQYRGGIEFADSLRYICGQYSMPVSEEIVQYMERHRKETKAACFSHLHPDILPMLETLRKRGYRLGILSNCSGEEVSAIYESVLVPFFDQIILSHETGLCKPEKAIYHLAAEKLGTAPTECIFIGDGGSRELYGAAEAGMHSYRAMWYIRQMPDAVREMPEFMPLENPMDILEILQPD